MSPPRKAPFTLVLFVLSLAAGTGCAASSDDGPATDALPLNGAEQAQSAVQLDLDERTETSLDRSAEDIALGREKVEAQPGSNLADLLGLDFSKAAKIDIGVSQDISSAQKPLVRPETP